MKKFPLLLLLVAVTVSLLTGGIVGFFLGVASTELGQDFIDGMVEQEQPADVARPLILNRAGFQLKYPSNWYVDVDDEDYDPDQMFSVDSPGSSYVMFVIGYLDAAPEETLKEQVAAFDKFLGGPTVTYFQKYGQLDGKGAILRGKVMGFRTTVRVFSYSENGQTVVVTEQYPDEDLKLVEDGLTLIEDSFTLNADGVSQ